MPTSTLPDNPSSAHSVDDAAAPQYAISASASLQERRTRTLKHGDTFAVFDQRGDIGGEIGNSEGLYHRDTRILSQFQLLLEETRPLLLSSMTQDDNAVFSADLSNPDLLVADKIVLRREQLHLHRTKFVWKGVCYERLLVRNFSDAPLYARVSFRFASDFADLFEVRGERRTAHGVASAALEGGNGVLLSYSGLDGVGRDTRLTFDPAPKTLTTGRAAYEFQLRPGETRRVFIRYGVPRRHVRLGRPRLLPADARRPAHTARIERPRRQRRQLEFRFQ